MYPRWRVAIATAASAVLSAASAQAWQEAHETGDDVSVRVEAGGTATVEHALRWRVVHGQVKEFDLAGFALAEALDPTVVLMAEDGRAIPAHAVRQADGLVRILSDDARPLSRGTFTVRMRSTVDLVAAGMAVRDDSTFRLTLRGLVASDSFDTARAVFDFPVAPDPPVALMPDSSLPDEHAATELERGAVRDRLTLVCPHVSRGEAVTWTLRVDARSLAPGRPDERGLRADVDEAAPSDPSRLHAALLGLGLAAIVGLYGALVATKARLFASRCAEESASPRPLIPLSIPLRASLAGLALAGGVALEMGGHPTTGAFLVAAAALLAAERAPVPSFSVRRPGRWLVLRPDDAFALTTARVGPDDWLDAGTARGRALVVGAALLFAAFAMGWRRGLPDLPWLIAIDAVVLVPIFWSGRAAQMIPDLARAPAPWLARLFGRLRRVEAVRVAPWARVRLDGALDELRLLVVPRAALPGLVGIEVGRAWSRHSSGWVSSAEVLVRFVEGTSAASHFMRLAESEGSLPGRRPDERVLRFSPGAPASLSSVVALVTRFALGAVDPRELPTPRAQGAARSCVDEGVRTVLKPLPAL
jgi:hypothetical protein